MSMFDNYPDQSGYIPENQPKPLYRSIQKGATETIQFEHSIPASSITGVNVSFVQGFDIVSSYDTDDVNITNTEVTVSMPQTDTLKFNAFVPAYAQLKIKYTLNNGVVVTCNNIERFIVKEVIDKETL